MLGLGSNPGSASLNGHGLRVTLNANSAGAGADGDGRPGSRGLTSPGSFVDGAAVGHRTDSDNMGGDGSSSHLRRLKRPALGPGPSLATGAGAGVGGAPDPRPAGAGASPDLTAQRSGTLNGNGIGTAGGSVHGSWDGDRDRFGSDVSRTASPTSETSRARRVPPVCGPVCQSVDIVSQVVWYVDRRMDVAMTRLCWTIELCGCTLRWFGLASLRFSTAVWATDGIMISV